jgi:hypothetical protein
VSCDTTWGPCACGAWHDARMPTGSELRCACGLGDPPSPREVIAIAQRTADAANDALQDCIERMQSACKHSHYREADAYSWLFGTDPPFRVCVDCGYAEEGWGCCYYRLGAGDYNLSYENRDEIRKLVIGKIWSQKELQDIRFGGSGSCAL